MSTSVLLVIAFTFALAGLVKGVIGMGLPTVSLAMLTATIGLHEAMALLIVPSLVTNVWQAFVGGRLRAIVVRTWPFLVMATGTVWIGAIALDHVGVARLAALLGLVLVAYAAVGLARLKLLVSPRVEPWLGPVAGVANGVLTGMTGSFVVPGVMYLQALALPRDTLIQAMGILFSLSTLALAVALGDHGLLDAEMSLVSIAAVAPALAGMVAGQRLRLRLSEERFRRVFFASVAVLGLYIVARALGPG